MFRSAGAEPSLTVFEVSARLSHKYHAPPHADAPIPSGQKYGRSRPRTGEYVRQSGVRMTVERRPANVSVLVLTLALAGLLSACTRDCTDMLGTYPPDAVVMTGLESVEVPYAAWGVSRI